MALDKFAVKQGIEYVNDGDSTSFTSVLVPAGTIALYPGSSVPAGWVECNGQELLIGASGSQYNSLYATITNSGSAFPYGENTNGSGSAGSTHFRVPDLRGRVAVGSGTGSGLTARTLGAWGGSQSVAVTDAVIAHTHNFPHSHTQPHTHTTTHGNLFSPGHSDSHTHTVPSHTHSIGTAPNAHTHRTYFSNTNGSGTFSRRIQTTSGPLNATHVNPAGTHDHPTSATPIAIGSFVFTSGDATTLTVGAAAVTPAGGSVTTSGGPSAANTQPATGPLGDVSSISVVQKSYVLKYIMKI